MPRPIVALATAVIVFVVLTYLFAAWQRGFSDGARQAADQILADADQTTDVIRLQAQLDEQRRAEDRISATVLTAFAAGVTVLVVVNIVALVFAQQSYQRDKDALEIVLGQKAKDLDQEQFQNWATALSQKDHDLRAYTDERVARVEDRQAAADTRMDQLSEIAASGSNMARALSAIISREYGDQMEEDGRHIAAARAYSQAAQVYAQGGDAFLSHALIKMVVSSLRNAQAYDEDDNNRLDAIVANLRAVGAALPQEVEVSALSHEALSQVERIRPLRSAGGT